MTKVNNVEAWAWDKAYMVIRYVEGEYWFYDAWDDGEKAMSQAWEIDGELRRVDCCEVGRF